MEKDKMSLRGNTAKMQKNPLKDSKTLMIYREKLITKLSGGVLAYFGNGASLLLAGV